MKKKKIQEGMINWSEENNKASIFLDNKARAPKKLIKGKGRKTGNYSFGS